MFRNFTAGFPERRQIAPLRSVLSKLGSERGEGRRKFKIFGDELILDILELQMKSKKKKKVLGGDYLFKLSKGGDLKKEFRKP